MMISSGVYETGAVVFLAALFVAVFRNELSALTKRPIDKGTGFPPMSQPPIADPPCGAYTGDSMGPYAAQDPLNPPPSRINPILFQDGFSITPLRIHELGMLPVVDGEGRIVMLMTTKSGEPSGTMTVEEWCGIRHGARIS